jgi:hypothetical protein
LPSGLAEQLLDSAPDLRIKIPMIAQISLQAYCESVLGDCARSPRTDPARQLLRREYEPSWPNGMLQNDPHMLETLAEILCSG